MPLQFDADLKKLKVKLVRMGAIVERMINDMNSVLLEQDTERLAGIYEHENELDRIQVELDDETVRLIGVYTPVARDLRVLLVVTRVNAEIERIGDKVVDIGHFVENFIRGKGGENIIDFSHMTQVTEKMVHNSLDAFVNGSVEGAMEVIKTDDEVDRQTDNTVRVLFTHMLDNPQTMGRILGLMLAAQAIEKIADHAVNIAEDVVYMVKGKDIRHTGIGKDKKDTPTQ
jgi:phosphate transport system protein